MSNPTEPHVHQVSEDEIKEKTKQIFKQMKKSSGSVPKWMRVMANCEDIFLGFFSMFRATMDEALVDKKLKWKIAYFVSDINKCEYCVSISLSQLKTFGIEKKDIENINGVSDEKELVALAYAEAATSRAYDIDQKTIDNMKKYFSDSEIVEITAVVSLFNYINRFNDSLGILPDA